MNRIVDVNIHPMNQHDNEGLVAIANMIVYIPVHISGVGVFKDITGELHLRYPGKDRNRHYVHPINKNDSRLIENVVKVKVRKMVANA